MKTWTKVCGITRQEDAGVAIDAGADAIGLILTESPRRVDPEKAFKIRQGLPEHIECVGVFTNESLDEILDLAALLKLDKVQLHSTPESARIKAVAKSFPVIQAARVLPDGRFNHSAIQLPADYILLDTAIKGMSGGTGRMFDWSILANLDMSRLIVAGGVGPQNVGELVSQYRPFGVDASSQLESAPGIKDPEKVRQYLQAIRSADSQRG